MTKKEKAIELINKMSLNWYCNECHNDFAKECALIAVDEIIKVSLNSQHSENYWRQVKQEIVNL